MSQYFGDQFLAPKLGGKLPPRTARLAVPPGSTECTSAQTKPSKVTYSETARFARVRGQGCGRRNGWNWCDRESLRLGGDRRSAPGRRWHRRSVAERDCGRFAFRRRGGVPSGRG